MATLEPAPVVQKSYTLVLWMLQKVENFPRSQRFTIGERIAATALDLQSALVEAAFTSRRGEPLLRAQRHLNTLQFLIRMARDLKILTADSYGYAAGHLDEVGRMTGGWRKSVGDAG